MMKNLYGASLLTSGLVLSVFTACAAPSSTDADAPEVATDALDVRDEGTGWNGWTQTAEISTNQDCSGPTKVRHTLTGGFGDNTRGGGGCAVQKPTISVACSSDTTCTGFAQGIWGSSAHGYCYQGTCYYRPGSQSTFCALNPNRTPGTLVKDVTAYGPYGSGEVNAVIGCMTKSAGPNSACGGTNPSLYMRTASNHFYYGGACE